MKLVTESKEVDFVVRLVGSGVKPWRVPLRSLSKLMEAIQGLVEQDEDEGEQPAVMDADDQEGQLLNLGSHVLNLVGIRSQSAGYAIATPFKDTALSVLERTGRAIDDPSNSEWSAVTVASIKDVSEIARSLGVKVEIRKPSVRSRLGDVIARITPTTYTEVANAAFVVGPTSLYGTVERIGGASAARCAFRLPNESKLVYCSVASDELAKKISRNCIALKCPLLRPFRGFCSKSSSKMSSLSAKLVEKQRF